MSEVRLPADCARRFRHVRALAAGGFGEVHLAVQIALDREVAIKIPTSGGLKEPQQMERFIAEARTAAQIDHGHVVRVLDYGAQESVPWIAYEYITGPSLRARLESGTMSWTDAVTSVMQTALAADAAHRAGIIHRDIKPENVLEASPGCFKLTDFGIARWMEGAMIHTGTGLLLGTPAYLAPEYIRGSTPGPKLDQYALGIMLFEVLAGRTPFQSRSPMELLQMHLNKEPPGLRGFNPRVPAVLEGIYRRAVAKDPADRQADCAAFAAELEQVLVVHASGAAPVGVQSGGAAVRTLVSARTSISSPATVKTGFSFRWRTGIAAGAALLVISITFAGMSLRDSAPPRSPPPPSTSPAVLVDDEHRDILEDLRTKVIAHGKAVARRFEDLPDVKAPLSIGGRAEKRTRLMNSRDYRDDELRLESRQHVGRLMRIGKEVIVSEPDPRLHRMFLEAFVLFISNDLFRGLTEEHRKLEQVLESWDIERASWVTPALLAKLIAFTDSRAGEARQLLDLALKRLDAEPIDPGARAGIRSLLEAYRKDIEESGDRWKEVVDRKGEAVIR